MRLIRTDLVMTKLKQLVSLCEDKNIPVILAWEDTTMGGGKWTTRGHVDDYIQYTLYSQ